MNTNSICAMGYGLLRGECFPCVPGTYSNLGTVCFPASPGEYTDEYGAKMAKLCPESAFAGGASCPSAEVYEKVDLAEGYYSPDGRTSYICPTGYFSEAGASSCSSCTQFSWYDHSDDWLVRSTSSMKKGYGQADIRSFLCGPGVLLSSVIGSWSHRQLQLSAEWDLDEDARRGYHYLSVSGDNRRLSDNTWASTNHFSLTIATDPTASPTMSPTLNLDARQRRALVDLYSATGGPSWIKKTNWNTSAGYNTWFGVAVNSLGNVVSITMSANNLVGTIPTTISFLTGLQTLQLNNNRLRSPLPESLLLISSTLADVRLRGNLFTGTIPTFLGQLTKLTYLTLRFNAFVGTIPTEIVALTRLQNLFLRENALTGTIPSLIGNLVSLQQLFLSLNKLTGTVPTTIGQLTNCVVLELFNNFLRGSLPESMKNLNLQVMAINENRFSGSLPASFNSSFGNFPLAIMTIQNNSFTGTISRTMCEVNLPLLMFTANNQFSCYETCAKLGNPKMFLQYLGDTEYPVCSSQYDVLCELQDSLHVNDYLDSPLAVKQLTTLLETLPATPIASGTLDSSATYSTYKDSYSWIEASNDHFEVFFDQTVYSGYGRFMQEVYCTICSSSSCQLRYLNASTTNLPGLSEIPSLTISGSVLTVLCVRRLYVKALNVPSTFIPISFSVKRFWKPVLWNCPNDPHYDDSLGSNLCSWQGVECSYQNTLVTRLDLSRSQLVGTIPPSIGQLALLQTLDLSNNRINGSIPSTIGALTALRFMNMSNNQLTGTLPTSLRNLTGLVGLQLATNKISGTLPTWLSELQPSLRGLDLRANSIEGKVIHELCDLSMALVNLESNDLLTCYEGCVGSSPGLGIALSVGLPYCAPSGAPTSRPTASPPTPKYHFSPGAIAGISVGSFVVAALLLCLILGIAYYYFVARHLEEERLAYQSLPVHKAIVTRMQLDEDIVAQNVDSVKSLDPKGNAAIDLALSVLDESLFDADVLYTLLVVSLHFDVSTGNPFVEGGEDTVFAWAKFVQHSDPLVLAVVTRMVQEHDGCLSMFCNSVDAQGRRCIDIASPSCRDIINRAVYLHGRFELKAGPPEHKSATSLVRFAMDHRLTEEGVDVQERVALKFMKDRQQFLSEIESRVSAGFSAEFVLAVLESFDGDSSEREAALFRASAVKKGYEEYPYCLVMNVADTNLQSYIMKQNVAGNDWDAIRFITKSLVQCIKHVHSKMIMHGDIKPMNVVLMDNAVRLIDFDASASFDPQSLQMSGRKYSSAYLPPEMFYLEEPGAAAVRSVSGDRPRIVRELSRRHMHRMSSKSFTPCDASPAQDMWAIGAVLYLLCTGTPLFAASVEDNIVKADMIRVHDWTDELKEEKLGAVQDRYARNLLSLLLVRDPLPRLDAVHVLSHPFLTGMQPERLQGDEPEFDVFLSYRVDSDSLHVEMLYNALTALELKVWWDKVCLKPGQPWEEGFCDGLVNSHCFVCLLSRNAINHPDKPWQNFKSLEAGSRCDNVLLEWRLALELRERKMINGVFPIFFGDISVLENEHGGPIVEYSDYFGSGCHPSPLPDVAVQAVEKKLREHLGRQGLGMPYHSTRTVQQVVGDITANQGGFVRGEGQLAMDTVCENIVSMRKQIGEKESLRHHAAADSATDAENRKFEGIIMEQRDRITMLEALVSELSSNVQ